MTFRSAHRRSAPESPKHAIRRRPLPWFTKRPFNSSDICVQSLPRDWSSRLTAGTVALTCDLIDQHLQVRDFVLGHEIERTLDAKA